MTIRRRAIINYYFKSAPKDEVKLEILDANGKLVRSLSSKEKKEFEQPPEWPDQVKEVTTIPAGAGMNRYAWNLRWEPPTKIPGAFYICHGPAGSNCTAWKIYGEAYGWRAEPHSATGTDQ